MSSLKAQFCVSTPTQRQQSSILEQNKKNASAYDWREYDCRIHERNKILSKRHCNATRRKNINYREKSLMDIANNTGKFVTTIQISLALRQEIKNRGMTINGALIEGWAAIKERQNGNEMLKEVQENLEKYRSAWLRLKERVEELEKK